MPINIVRKIVLECENCGAELNMEITNLTNTKATLVAGVWAQAKGWAVYGENGQCYCDSCQR